jgi:anaerobic carbon-monoxide dehydrogenase iron sulfur subunit
MKEVFVHLDRCRGCHSCELACAVEHSQSKNLFGAVAEKPVPRRRLFIERIGQQNIPMLCRHCDNASCVQVCRTGALSQDPITHTVSHDPDRCIGCWMCTMVCPYGVIGSMQEERIAVKCDRCPDRDAPACVAACPVGALVYAEEGEFAERRRRSAAGGLAEGYRAGAGV